TIQCVIAAPYIDRLLLTQGSFNVSVECQHGDLFKLNADKNLSVESHLETSLFFDVPQPLLATRPACTVSVQTVLALVRYPFGFR
ncbi:hypothetical protein, partial [Pseudomonas sp. KCJK9000]|uniref:hypothetical protein n=1 Tax=Pseudomonas sp. KCJK9000 TaxID=3344566 RepID=UPI003906CB85